ncbi:MAG: leucine-rich repeat domain-containing protein, partial [Candidatus Heimdallarchaeota archaeon]|nr:leucine-rich repeat domain-containing protein [Candidatus Heimdallarchaeota archaeon]
KGLDALTNLTVLYLNNNNITEIKNLESLVNLETLYLDTNQLTSLENLESFEKLEKLYVLFLGMNPIEGEERQFAQDNIEKDRVKELLKSYKEWKKNN